MCKRILVILLCITLLSIFSLILSAQSTPTSNLSPIFGTSGEEWSVTWNHTYADSNLVEVDSVIAGSDGFLLAGKTYVRLGDKIGLLKVDSLGNRQWEETYDAVGNFLSRWLIRTGDSGYALAGQQNGGFWLAKIDEEGTIEWNQTIMGDGFSWATCIIKTADDGFALTGQTGVPKGKTFLSSDEAEGVIWLVKTDSSGNKQWSKTLGSGMVNSLIQTSDGGYALAANINSDYMLIKTNTDGELEWKKTYGSEDKDAVYSVVQTIDGGYALGGWMWLRSEGGPNFALVMTDNLGNEKMTKNYGDGFARCMIKTADGGFALGGNKLVKVDSNGTKKWEVSLNGSLMCQAYSICETQDGAYAVAGSILSEEGISSAFLAKIGLNTTQNQASQGDSSFDLSVVISTLVICIVIIVLGFVVYFKNKKEHF